MRCLYHRHSGSSPLVPTKNIIIYCPIAQFGSEHLPYKQGVVGSKPTGTTIPSIENPAERLI